MARALMLVAAIALLIPPHAVAQQAPALPLNP